MPPPEGSPAPPRTPPRRTRVGAGALTGLLVLAIVCVMHFAQDFLVPVMFAVMLSFLLRPVVRGFHRCGLPHGVGAALVVSGTLALTVYASMSLYEPARAWIERAPETFRRVEHRLQALRKPVEDVGRAAAEVEKLATATGDQVKVTEVQVKGEAWTTAFLRHSVETIASFAITLFLLFFLLATDGRLLRRLFELLLPARLAAEGGASIVETTEGQISRYLFTVAAINVVAGLVVAGAMWLLGMPNPLLWGVLEMTLNFIPYLGAMSVAVVTTLVAIVTFDDLRWIFVPLTYLAITNLEGMLVTPYVLGRRFELDPVVVFLWLLFWGAIWGIGGALLAMPMLVLIRILSERVAGLAPVLRLIEPGERLPWRLPRRRRPAKNAVSTA